MKTHLLSTLLFLCALGAGAQALTDSNLPIVIITTDVDRTTGQPREILDDPKVPGTMKIIFRPDGSRNYESDQNTAAYLNYNGRIGIELRGSTSQLLPKKPYGLTTLQADNQTNNNVSLLGMPRENDWVLNSLAYDPSLLRDYLSYDLARQIGTYAARGRYCEVIVNGDYKGLYLLLEKLKADSERVNIQRLTATDNVLPALSGGYLTKADKTTGGDPVAWQMESHRGDKIDFIHENPKPADITRQQSIYIRDYFMAFQKTMDDRNESLANGWPSLIDVPSFVDFMLMSELTSNVDSYKFSTFFHKDLGGKLRAGPIWDYNLTYGNDLFQWNFNRSLTQVWQFNNNDNEGPRFWLDLYSSPSFRCQLTRRWQSLVQPGQPLSFAVISARIDDIVREIGEATGREERRWRTVGNHAARIGQLKNWLQARLVWLGASLSNSPTCTSPNLPKLVISKINYNPRSVDGVAGNDLEFIEITNQTGRAVPLAGVNFRELGISYQFPAGVVARASAKLYLASNAGAFQKAYGFAPVGQFFRNLSNRSQRLVLADAYGNVIDQVEYFDAAPWPTEPDGRGAYLSLKDPASDNNVAANWASATNPISVAAVPVPEGVVVYPNPTTNELNIDAGNGNIVAYEITDLTGRVLLANPEVNAFYSSVSLAGLPESMYLLRLYLADGGSLVRRVSKL